MTESVKILTADYLDWHAKLSGLPSVLTDKIRTKLCKRYKKKTENEPWQLSEAHLLRNSKPENKVSSFPEQCEEEGPITFEAKPYPELIIKSVLKHFPYLKFKNSSEELIIIFLHHLSRGAHHVLFAMDNTGIMDYMANGMVQNIVLLASLQAINSNS
jgi:hypothetical protein